MALKIQLRRGTASEWTTANPVLMQGEMGVETDTLKVKLGDGTTAWTSLPYFTQGMKGDTGATGATGPKGDKGEKGDIGDTGPANELTVGTVTTGAAGSDAVVTITGDAPNQTISFTIPQGIQGIQGIQGVKGDTGLGVPTGGTDGQIIVKTVDGTAWVDNVVPQVKYTVKNSSGATIPKGSVVYISGSNGTNILISLADADTEATSSKTVGIVETDIANNAFGYVVTEGLLAGLNTSGATAGDSVWLSSTSGAFVFGAPPAKPAHSVYLGVVSRVNSSNGEIFVKVQNGYELEELHNVEITSPADKQVLAYEGGLWKNKVASGGVTVSEPAPSSPIDGDGWFYATDGTLFVRYNDGNSTQWVQPNAVLSSQIEQRYYSPNYVINGGFDIWQRGTSTTTAAAAYRTADRWATWIDSGSGTISQDTTNVPAFLQYGIRFTSSGANGSCVFYHTIETLNAELMAGKTVNLSAYLTGTNGRSIQVSLWSSTTTDNVFTGTWSLVGATAYTASTTTSRISASYTVPANAKTVQVRVYNLDKLANTEFVSFTGVQLEEGSTATAFRRNANSIQGELAACQRYYYVGFAGWSGLSQGAGYIPGFTTFPVSMRVPPTISVLANGVGRYHSSYAGVVSSISGVNFSSTSTYATGFHFDTNLASNAYTVGTSTTDIQYAASAEL